MKSKIIKNNNVGLFLSIGKRPHILHVDGTVTSPYPKASLSLSGRDVPLQTLHLVKGFCELGSCGNNIKLMRFYPMHGQQEEALF